jgi:peptidyl-prolyl cis-trans isomerase SurA
MTDIARLRPLPALLCGLALFALNSVSAQSLRLSSELERAGSTQPSVATRTVDYIVALVNSEPVTNSEVRQRLLRVEQQYAQRGVALPPREELARLVLEQLVAERAQQQEANELGLRVDEASLAQAEQAIAAQNQLTPEEFRRRVAAEGLDINRMRNELRGQILLQRVREREVELRVKVNESEIDAFIREQGANNPDSLELSLAHVLVQVPDSASAARISELQARAQSVADRARAGGDFAALAREFSDAPEGATGGEFGWRPIARLPDLFVEATRSLVAGGIAGPLRSEAGFHVLKLIDRRQAGSSPEFTVTQTRARHILLRTGPQLSQADAVARLNRYRQQVASGQGRFEELAREHSQDGSAGQGGDLGWSVPGQFVPEFEEVMDRLQPGEMSQPLVSRFGVHLIRVDERRDTAMNEREQREVARARLRDQKAQAVLLNWSQDVRARAFVEYREDPRP